MENAAPQPLASVRLAIRFLWASWAVTFVSWVLTFVFPVSNEVQMMAANAGVSIPKIAFAKMIGMGFWTLTIYFVLKQLAKGKNWARMVCLAAVALQLAKGLLQFLSHFGQDSDTVIWISFTVHGLHLLLDCCALYLLFLGAGKALFKQTATV